MLTLQFFKYNVKDNLRHIENLNNLVQHSFLFKVLLI